MPLNAISINAKYSALSLLCLSQGMSITTKFEDKKFEVAEGGHGDVVPPPNTECGGGPPPPVKVDGGEREPLAKGAVGPPAPEMGDTCAPGQATGNVGPRLVSTLKMFGRFFL